MNFEKVINIFNKYFGKPKELSNKYGQPYAEYYKYIKKYSLRFIVSFYYNNQLSVVIYDNSRDNGCVIFHTYYDMHTEKELKNVFKKIKIIYENLYKLNR